MATVSQLPAQLNYNAVAGNPSTLVFNVSLKNSSGNPISWGTVTGYQVDIIDQFGNTPSGVSPSVSSPSSGVINVAWTSSQTLILSNTQAPRFSLSLFIASAGPYAVAAGALSMTPPEYPAIPIPS
jgi:hypothetical protein